MKNQYLLGCHVMLKLKNWMLFSSALLATLISTSYAYGENKVEAIHVGKIASGQTVIRISLKDEPAAAPAAFLVKDPPRLALDFKNTTTTLNKSNQEVSDASVRSYNLVQVADRLRVVFNLNQPFGYDTQIEGKEIVLTLQESGGRKVVSPAANSAFARFAEDKNQEALHAIRDIDFRRGKYGEGRIVVDLSDSSTGIDIRQQGRNLIVEFMQTTLPRNLERRMDVNDFATPVTLIDAFAQGKNARLVIEPKGLWEHSAYQADNRFIIEVKPVQEDPTKLVQGTKQGYKGEKLSLNFQNIEVRSVLQVIADFTGLNIITSDTVNGNLTLRLKDVPWDQALDIVLQTKGLDMRKNGNVVLIAPREELATKEKLELESKQQIGELEPLQTEMFQLNYQKAEAIQKLLNDKTQAILSKRGSVVFDPRTNILFVQDTAMRLEAARKIIQKIDVSIRQVMIETRLVIADDKFSKKLGVRFGNQGGHRLTNNINIGTSGTVPNANTYAVGQTPYGALGATVPSSQVTAYGQEPLPYNVNLPVVGAAGNLALTFLNLGSGNLINLELSALEAANRGKVISNPRVVTSDNMKAVIEQGMEVPYIIPGTGNSQATVAFKRVVLSLNVTPQITPDNRVIMSLEIKKDTVADRVQFAGFDFPSIATRVITTQIAVNNGETAVIGGIYEEETRRDKTQVPFFGDLPIVGNLFKTTGDQENRAELLIFITPRVMTDSMSTVLN